MNKDFETEFKRLASNRKAAHVEDLNSLRGYTVAFDANLLLEKVTPSQTNPR